MKLDQITLTEAEKEDNQIEHLINRTLFISVLTHYWHWQTKSYAAHKALGDFYEEMTELVDELAEAYMGSGGEIKATQSFELEVFEPEAAKKRISDFKDEIKEIEAKLMGDEFKDFHGVADHMISIIQECDKLLYLFTLK